MLSTLAFASMVVSTMAHGRLIKPLTRVGHTSYENDPVKGNQYICRHAAPNQALTPDTVDAGEKVTVRWVTTAAHVGDCALYMSYDGDKALGDMRWFKIANKQDCKSFTGQDVQFDLPSWLPGGNAVLRWEWYALHVSPTIEFYAQCTDIVVNPTPQALTPADIPMFKIYENGEKTSLPLDSNDGVGFRNPFAGGGQTWTPTNGQYMTGPSCALDLATSSTNDCALTAPGTAGHVDMDIDGTPVTTPVAEPTSEPAPVETYSPTYASTESPVAAAPTQPPVQSVAPPTEQPVEAPVEPPTEQPVEAPVAPPTEPPVQAPVAPPTEPPIDGDCSTPLFNMYGQCAGQGFVVNNPNGCPLCPAGFQCYRSSVWYSNCNHSCPQGLGWDCENDAEHLPAPTPAPEEDESDCPNGEWDTCNGSSNPNAAYCCQAGLTCVVKSQWHSQCERV